MAHFSFVVDRAYQVKNPLTLYTDLALAGEAVTLNPGDSLVYRGVIEIEGVPRYTFDHAHRKLYTRQRPEIVDGLEENYDELVQID